MYIKEENEGRRTQEERRAATRRALLGAARELFAEGGYHSTAAGEIVKRAGLTRGAMYHHFEDKRDLFRAVVEEVEVEVDEIVLAEASRALDETSSQWEAFRGGTGRIWTCVCGPRCVGSCCSTARPCWVGKSGTRSTPPTRSGRSRPGWSR